MSHVDEGLLHAWLDGALYAGDDDIARDVERHLDACADCRARLEEARRLRAEAGAILGVLVPSDPGEAPPFEALLARRAAESEGTAGALAAAPSGTQVGAGRRRTARSFPLPLAWAASLVLALGAGWWANRFARPYGPTLGDHTPDEAFLEAGSESADATAQAGERVEAMAAAPRTEAAPAAPRTDDRAAAGGALRSARAREEIAAPSLMAPEAAPKLAADLAPDRAVAAVEEAERSDGWRIVERDAAERLLDGPAPAVPGLPIVDFAVAADGRPEVRVRQRIEGGEILEITERMAALSLDAIVVTGAVVSEADSARADRRLAEESRRAPAEKPALARPPAAQRAAPAAAATESASAAPSTAADPAADADAGFNTVESARRIGFTITGRARLPADSIRTLLERIPMR